MHTAWTHESVAGFYRTLVMNLVRSLPGRCVTLVVYIILLLKRAAMRRMVRAVGGAFILERAMISNLQRTYYIVYIIDSPLGEHGECNARIAEKTHKKFTLCRLDIQQ